MRYYTLNMLRELKNLGTAFDLSNANNRDKEELIIREGFLRHIGYSNNFRGNCNGLLLEGETTNNKYVIIGRTPALRLFS